MIPTQSKVDIMVPTNLEENGVDGSHEEMTVKVEKGSTSRNKRFRKMDSAYSVLVLVAAFYTNMVAITVVIHAPSLLLVEWFSVFDRPKAVLSWVPSACMLTYSISGLIVGGLITRFGPRRVQIAGACMVSCMYVIAFVLPYFEALIVCYLFIGFGGCLLFNPPVIIIYDYFDKYKSLASGISMCGHGLSTFVMVALLRYCIDLYGWRGTMLIIAGLTLQTIVCAMFFVENKPQENKNGNLFLSFKFSVMRNVNFFLFIISFSMYYGLMFILHQLSPSRAVSKGMTKMEGSLILSCVGIASTASRIIVSFISNLKCTSHIGFFVVLTTLTFVPTFASCKFTEDFLPTAVLSGLAGLGLGGVLTLLPVVLVDILGAENLPNAFGIIIGIAGLLVTLLPPFAGYLFDITGDFNTAFYLGSGLGLSSGILSLVVVFRLHCFKKENNKVTEIPCTVPTKPHI